MTTRPVIAVVGAGALGGYYGGRLAQHGHDVHFLLRSDYRAVKQNGWVVRSCDGDFVIPADQVNAYDDSRSMPRADLVIVTLKATSNDQYEPLIRPLVGDATLILTLQNGLGNEERLAELFGAERILGGLAFVCLNRTGPGQVHHMDHGMIRVGDFTEGRMDRAEQIARMFGASRIRCDTLGSLRYGRWEKLVWNVPFNGLGAACDLTTDLLIGDEGGREVVQWLMGEIIAAANALGVKLPQELIDTKVKQTTTMGPYASSMQVDRQMGRPMEVEAILGEPLRQARRAGVATPRLAMLYELVRLVNLGNERSAARAS